MRKQLLRKLCVFALIVALSLLVNISYLYLHTKENSYVRQLTVYTSQDIETTQASNNHIRYSTDLRNNFTNESMASSDVRTTATTVSTPVIHKRVASVIVMQKSSLPSITTPPTAMTQVLEKRTGYVLADDYWEQQTSGSRNLQNLQCWARKLNLVVVEPYMYESRLRTLLASSTKHGRQIWKFGDFFSLESWNEYSKKKDHALLVPWDEFIKKASRNVILVRFKHEYEDTVRKMEKLIKQDPGRFPPPSERYKVGCSSHGWPKSGQLQLLTSQGYTVVKEVCFNFEYGSRLTTQQFNEHLYGNYTPEEVTIIFKQWRGTGPPARILINDSHCPNTFIQEFVNPSPRLVYNAQQYRDKYLSGGNYIAIMARLEKTKISMRKRKGIIPYCFREIIKYWNVLKAETGIQNTFLSIDIGKYGSNSFRNTGDESDLMTEFEKFFKELYGNSLSVAQWEHTLEDISGTTEAGHIALLQKVIVTRASCVIFVGGGTFQKHAVHLYQKLHTGSNDQCIRIVTECTTPSNLSL